MAGEEDDVVAAERPLPARRPEIHDGGGGSAALRMDYFSQARKALSERSPFDLPGEPSTSAVVTLPSGLASLLNRHGDSRRRHKKSQSGGGEKKKKKSSRANDKSRVRNIWVETEEYFRDLTLADIDTLVELSSCSSLASRECFTIPRLGGAKRFNVVSTSCVDEKNPAPTGFNVVSCEEGKKDGEELKNEDGLLGVESIDNVVAAETALPQDDKNGNASDSCVSLEWFLGCRNKVSSTTERPRKRRKLLGGDAGLERVLMTSPSDGNQPFCHYCGKGDIGTGRESHRLIVCASCKVAVHRKCYGVQDEDVDESWLCSWCKQKGDVGDSVNPCVLCPKKGGALKPLNSSGEGDGSTQFVHLFCCLWMPEVYVDDLKKMEPVMNVGSVKKTRSKLVCNVCKMKCGTCVRCNHGTFCCIFY